MLKHVDKTNAVIWFFVGGFFTACIPGTNVYWDVGVATFTAVLTAYIGLVGKIERPDDDTELSSVESVTQVAFHSVNTFYWMTGMMYLSANTDRYFHIRPGDAAALIRGIQIFLTIGIPVFTTGWLAVWLFEPLHPSLWWLLGGNSLLLLLPPIYAHIVAERELWRYRKNHPIF